MSVFAERLRALPGVAAHLDAAAASKWRKRPSVPAGPLFNHPQALDVLTSALDELYEAVDSGSLDPPPSPRQPDAETAVSG